MPSIRRPDARVRLLLTLLVSLTAVGGCIPKPPVLERPAHVAFEASKPTVIAAEEVGGLRLTWRGLRYKRTRTVLTETPGEVSFEAGEAPRLISYAADSEPWVTFDGMIELPPEGGDLSVYVEPPRPGVGIAGLVALTLGATLGLLGFGGGAAIVSGHGDSVLQDVGASPWFAAGAFGVLAAGLGAWAYSAGKGSHTVEHR